jgi:hypothetical protein
VAKFKKIESQTITVPHNFRCRPYQAPIWNAIIKEGKRRAVVVWHRRSGKDKTFINILCTKACQRKGVYYYFLPTYGQGRKILWDGMDKAGFKFIDHIPEQLIIRKNDTEMKIELVNGSIIQVVGTDNFDSIMGTNPVGCVFSEYSLQDPKAWEFIRPILLENDGWAIFNFTPRGQNHAKDLYDMARTNKDWFCQLLTVNDTTDENGDRIVTDDMIDSERLSGMSETLIQQEYYCDFLHSTANILIPHDIIREAVLRQIEYDHGRKIGGLDVARFGDDSTVIAVRMGGIPTFIEKWQKKDGAETVRRVIDLYSRRLFDCLCVDSIGMGGTVADMLRDKNLFPVYDVNVSESIGVDERFSRLRDELWWKLRDWFYERKCKLPRIKYIDELIDDISKVTYDYLKGSEKIKVMSKADMKVVMGRSPDVADAFMMTFSVALDSVSRDLGRGNSAVSRQMYADSYYNPFEQREAV